MNNLFFCKYCNTNKSSEQFNKSNYTNNGLQYKCKECEREYRRQNKDKIQKRNIEYRERPGIKEKESIKNKEKYINNKQEIDKRNKKWASNNKEQIKIQKRIYRQETKEERRKTHKKWMENNIESYRKYQRDYVRNKRATNIEYKIEHRLRNRLLAGIKEGKGVKELPFIELTGATIKEVKIHLESLFTEGMTWDLLNQGYIEIDHKIPCCAFDLTKEEEQRKCFNWTNLQPLWWEDNNAKISEDMKLSIRNKD